MSKPEFVPEYGKYFFLRKVYEVEGRAKHGDYYDLMMAAGLLRHILLDRVALVHTANREHKLKLKFSIAPGIPLDKLREIVPNLTFHFPGLLPVPPMNNTVDVDVGKFLSTPCIFISGHEYTVRDILDTCANVRGGVHLGNLTPKDETLLAFDSNTRIMGHEVGSFALRQIIEVVLAGLKPLVDVLEREFQAKAEAAASDRTATEGVAPPSTSEESPPEPGAPASDS